MIWVLLIKSLVLIVILLSGFAGLMLMERKILGWFQYRLGPNRVGPWGVLQPVADAIKLIMKEDIIPADADRVVFWIAPIISLFVALVAFAFIPVGPPSASLGPLVISDPNAGLLAMLAITSLGVYGIALGGWASQSKYALLGSLRATAQMISYELAMGMSVLGVIILTASRLGDPAEGLRFSSIVQAQIGSVWYILPQVVGFLVFFVSTVAESNRTPFDLPEAEAELVAGYSTEYSGIRFALFYMAEYVNLITLSALTVTLYLGGWSGPGFLPPVLWFILKVLLFVFLSIWIRATLPRLRYDRLMSFGWKVMLPLAAANLLVTAVLVAI